MSFAMLSPRRFLYIFGCELKPEAAGGGGGAQNRKSRFFLNLRDRRSLGTKVL